MHTSQIRAALEARMDAHPAPPMDGRVIIDRSRTQRRAQRLALAAVAVLAAGGVAAAATATVTASSGPAVLVPAASPTPPVTAVNPLKVSVKLPGEGARLDPAGLPPATVAAAQRFLDNDKSWPLTGPKATTEIVYGLLTIDDPGIFQQSQELKAEPFGRTLTRYPVVVIIHGTPWPDAGTTLMAYTVLDPTTATPLYAFGQNAALWAPTETPNSPGYYLPEIKSATQGITKTNGPLPPSRFRATTKWVKDLGYQKQLGRHAYITVYAGTDYGFYQNNPNPYAAVVIVRPAYMTGPDSSNSRYVVTGPFRGDGSKYSGALTITGAVTDAHGHTVLTLRLSGTGETFNMSGDGDDSSPTPVGGSR